jgi:hypothetical protein
MFGGHFKGLYSFMIWSDLWIMRIGDELKNRADAQLTEESGEFIYTDLPCLPWQLLSNISTPNAPAPRFSHGMTVYNELIFVFGMSLIAHFTLTLTH